MEEDQSTRLNRIEEKLQGLQENLSEMNKDIREQLAQMMEIMVIMAREQGIMEKLSTGKEPMLQRSNRSLRLCNPSKRRSHDLEGSAMTKDSEEENEIILLKGQHQQDPTTQSTLPQHVSHNCLRVNNATAKPHSSRPIPVLKHLEGSSTQPQLKPKKQSYERRAFQKSGPRSKKQCFDPIPVSYTELLPILIQNQLIMPTPLIPKRPPYPQWYNPNAHCAYHCEAPGHSIEECTAFKYKVENLIKTGYLDFTGVRGSETGGSPSAHYAETGSGSTMEYLGQNTAESKELNCHHIRPFGRMN